MTWVNGLVAIAVIVGFVYILMVKMKDRSMGRRIRDWFAGFSPTNLIEKQKEFTKEASQQTWIEKREII